jgi:formylmethanofuran dehydrogenase subunit E
MVFLSPDPGQAAIAQFGPHPAASRADAADGFPLLYLSRTAARGRCDRIGGSLAVQGVVSFACKVQGFGCISTHLGQVAKPGEPACPVDRFDIDSNRYHHEITACCIFEPFCVIYAWNPEVSWECPALTEREPTTVKTLEEHLAEAAAFNGESCPGQTLGVRMGRAGLERLGVDDPLSKEWRKRLMVFVEMDRCAADALMVVTGCRVGKRTLKMVDYGIMAATFLDLETDRAVRLVAREESRALAPRYAPEVEEKYEQQRQAYAVMPDEELFTFEEVKVEVPEEDMPGRPLSRVVCENCGESVQDRREVNAYGTILCRACASKGYFTRF